MQKDEQYTYRNAGFNRFFRRSISSNPDTKTLKNAVSSGNRDLKFDDMQVSGFMGDTMRIGKINLDGKVGNLKFHDDRGEAHAILGEED